MNLPGTPAARQASAMQAASSARERKGATGSEGAQSDEQAGAVRRCSRDDDGPRDVAVVGLVGVGFVGQDVPCVPSWRTWDAIILDFNILICFCAKLLGSYFGVSTYQNESESQNHIELRNRHVRLEIKLEVRRGGKHLEKH